jgi:hypothetical protein
MPSGEIWGGNGPAAGALIGLTQGLRRSAGSGERRLGLLGLGLGLPGAALGLGLGLG